MKILLELVILRSYNCIADCIAVKEPLSAERHAQWCERSENEIGGKLLHFPPTRLYNNPMSLFINSKSCFYFDVHQSTLLMYIIAAV